MQHIFAKPGSEIVVDDPRECMIVHGVDARYELAKMFAREITRGACREEDSGLGGGLIADAIARKSIELADALIAALKEEK